MGSKAADHKVVTITGSTAAEPNRVRPLLATSLDPTGETAFFTKCDVSSYPSHSSLFKAVWDKWGRLDVYVANAGVIDQDSRYNFLRQDAPVTDLPPESNTTCSDVEYKSVIHGTVLATHFMQNNPAGKGGKITLIVIGSIVSIFPLPMMPEHCAAKAAVLQYVRAMAPLLKLKENITINTVLPCGVNTPVMPGFAEAFLPEHLTLPECLLKAYHVFLDDAANETTGVAVEVAHDDIFYHEVLEFKSGGPSVRTTLVYEPWFQYLHGVKSGLDDALQGPPSKST